MILAKKYLPLLRAFLLSGMMSFIMSGAITFMNLGWVETFFARWLHAWIVAYAIAFPAVLSIFPLANKIAMMIASKEDPPLQ